MVAADGAVGRQFHLEIADGLQRRTGVERLAVRLRVLVVQVGLLHEPPSRRRLVRVGAIAKPVSKHVGLLVTQQERQPWRVQPLVESRKRGARGVTRQQRAFVPGVGRTHVVQPHGEPQNVLERVDVALFLFLLFLDVAKPVATLVAHFPVFGSGATLVVDLLQVGHLVVEVLQVGLRVEADVAAVLNRVAEGVLRKRRTVPAERALVARVQADPIGQREFVKRELVRPVDLVVVGREFTALHEAGLYRIPVVVVCVGVVHLAGDFAGIFQHERLGTSLVIELQRLGQIVLDRVVPVPVPRFDHLRDDDGLQPQPRVQHLHVVAHLAHLVHALHLVGRRDLLGQEVKVEVLDELQVLGVPQEAHLRERLTLFGARLPVVIEGTAVLHVAEVVRVDVLAVLLVVAVVRREVGRADHGEQSSATAVASAASALGTATAARILATRITSTGVTAVLALARVVLPTGIPVFGSSALAHLRGDLHVGEVDASDLVDRAGVALARADGVQVVGVVDQIGDRGQIRGLHIRRQRVKLWRARLVAVAQIHGQGHAQLLRQQFAQLDCAVGVQALHGLTLAFLHPFLKSTPAWHGHVGGHADVRQIGQRRVGLRHRRPATFLVEARQAKLVHPQFRAFRLAVVAGPERLLQILVRVPDADHDGHHIGQRGVALHRKTLAVVHHRVHARG